MSRILGGGGGRQRLEGPYLVGVGSGSSSNVARPTVEMPATIAWWTLLTTATRPPLRPSTTVISHNGLFRSSSRAQPPAGESRGVGSAPARANAPRATRYER